MGRVLIVAAVVTGVLAVATTFALGSSQSESLELGAGSNYTYEEAESFTEYALFSLGSEFQGFEIEDMLSHTTSYDSEGSEESAGASYISLIYGTCTPDDEIGCAPPYEVQLWDPCDRGAVTVLNPVEDGYVTNAPDETLTVRGVTARFYDDWTRLEFYALTAAVVIFGETREDLLEAADAIEGINNEVGPEVDFPYSTECW